MANLEKYSEDLTTQEIASLDDYIKNGAPGLTKVKDKDILKWFDLYMSGKTYAEIAKIGKVDQNLVCYFSSKLNWHSQKLDHFKDLIANMTQKLTQVRLETQNALNTTVTAMNKYFEDRFNQYLKTGNKEFIETVDTKILVQYYKGVDTLVKLTTPVKSAAASTAPSSVSNLSEDEGGESETIEVTPKVLTEEIVINKKNAGDILKKLAGIKKSKTKGK